MGRRKHPQRREKTVMFTDWDLRRIVRCGGVGGGVLYNMWPTKTDESPGLSPVINRSPDRTGMSISCVHAEPPAPDESGSKKHVCTGFS